MKGAKSFTVLLSPPLSSAKASHRKTSDLKFDKTNAPALATAILTVIFSQINQHNALILCTQQVSFQMIFSVYQFGTTETNYFVSCH